MVVVVLLGATMLYPWLVSSIQPFPMTPLIAAYLGLLLLAAACIAYGMFVSSLTDSQVLAAFLTAMPLLLLWLLSWNEATTSLEVLPIVRAISLFNHFQPFTVGVIDLRDIFYFVFLAGVFVWATLQVLAVRQWRGRR
jgi:ABC-2 type transport system permease protein